MSGSTIAEICAPWGAVEAQIPVPPIPFSLAGADEQPEEQPARGLEQPPCAFCFSNDNVKTVTGDVVTVASVELLFKSRIEAASGAIIQKARREAYSPRDPPALV